MTTTHLPAKSVGSSSSAEPLSGRASPLWLLGLFLLVAAVYGPLVVRGEVIFPGDNKAEVHSDLASRPSATRKFTDVSCFFVPELQHHLQGERSGWISTWNPHVQLGRPSFHTHGLSLASPLTRFLALFSRDALVVYTAQVIATVLLTAVFGFLFLRSLGLAPPASFVGAAGLALGITACLYTSFAVFLSGPCWTLGLAWLVVRFLERATLARGLGIAFCVYVSALAGYPQHIVWDAYLIGILVLVRLARLCDGRARLRALLGLAAAGLAGALAAAPVLLDVAAAALRSSRDTYPGYLDKSVPSFESAAEVVRFFGQLVDPLWLGNPLEKDYPVQSPGFALGALFASQLAISWMDGLWRRTWPWLAFCALALALTLWRAAYDFAAAHLGLGLSVSSPLRGAWIAAFVCAAIALDHALRGGFQRRGRVLAVAALPLAPLLASARDWNGSVALGLGAFALALLVVLRPRPWIAVTVTVLATTSTARLLVSGWPRADVVLTSPVVERMRALTGGRSRYVVVEPVPAELLPPNEEALLGLCSVHSYDPLVSEQYKRLLEQRFGVETREYRKRFTRAAGTAWFRSPELELTDLALIVTGPEIKRAEGLTKLADIGGVFLCQPPWKPLPRARFADFEKAGDAATIALEDAQEGAEALVVLEERDDFTRLGCAPALQETLVFLSRQFHPHWRARASGAALETVRVNDFYLGVVVPPGTAEIELAFRPWARYAWIPQALFAAAALALLLARARRARPAPS